MSGLAEILEENARLRRLASELGALVSGHEATLAEKDATLAKKDAVIEVVRRRVDELAQATGRCVEHRPVRRGRRRRCRSSRGRRSSSRRKQ